MEQRRYLLCAATMAEMLGISPEKVMECLT
jgi:hypothetical protein